jgi:hypothetical protein
VTSDRFLEEDLRVLTPEAFEFVLNNELKRAVRSQTFLTLLLVHPTPKPETQEADRAHAVRHVARLIGREVRETDLISHTGQGQLAVVLLDADLHNSMQVVDRLLLRLKNYSFPTPLAIDVGAACCPTHGADPETLRAAAAGRPVQRGGNRGNASNAQ